MAPFDLPTLTMRVNPHAGLADRRDLTGDAGRLLRRAADDGLPVALALFELDRFEQIATAFGRPPGDRLLAVFARTVARHCRPGCIAGRVGDGRIVALIPGTGREGGVALAERVRVAFAEAAATVAGADLDATLSAGVAAGRGTVLDFASLIDVADGALRRARNFGGNRVVRGKPRPTPDENRKVLVRVA